MNAGLRRDALSKFPFDPSHQEVDDAGLAVWRDFRSLWDFPPFRQTSSATCRGGVLGDEYGMAAPWSLSAVVWRICRGKTRTYEIFRMATYRGDSFLGDVLPVRIREMKPRPEFRARKSHECRFVSCKHTTSAVSDDDTLQLPSGDIREVADCRDWSRRGVRHLESREKSRYMEGYLRR